MVCWNYFPLEMVYLLINLIYSFYDFKKYILRVISFKDIGQIFLNGIFLRIVKFA
jgi:hypothetical protein